MADDSEKNEGRERRRYQRVQFDASPQTLNVEVLGYGRTLVFDMSFSGAAIAQTEAKVMETPGELLVLHLKNSNDMEARVEAKVIRSTDRVVALDFIKVPPEGRLMIDRLISDRMIGLNMNLIDPQHYSATATFRFWFHGPKETNLFLWVLEDEHLEKAQFDLNAVSLIFEEGHFHYENKVEGVWADSPPYEPTAGPG